MSLTVSLETVRMVKSRQRKNQSERSDLPCHIIILYYYSLYNNQINTRAMIGQSAVGCCTGKPTEKSRVS